MSDAEKDFVRRLREEADIQPVKQEKPARKSGNGFSDIAGLGLLKAKVREGFINVLKNKECAKAYGLKPPSILLYGPSGCGKTFFVEKMAEETGINYMKIVPDDLASKWIHGSQEKIGELFRKAEKMAPVLLFLDEFDAMVPQRTADDGNQSLNGEVNEFLCMLNNAADKDIYVMAATNHPECIDKAVLRTGRIDEMIYIDMPDLEARRDLFKLALSKLPADDKIDYDRLASLSDGFNCSDISYIVKAASCKTFNDSILHPDRPYMKISQMTIEEAIARRSPSVSVKDLRQYERIRWELSPRDCDRKPARIGFKQS